MSADYPIFLNLKSRLCIVLGGGAVAEEKAEGLLQSGATVRVVAPQLTPTLARLARAGDIEHLARAYREGDLADAFLVLSERLGEATHRLIFAEANRLGIPANVQDEIAYCSFYAPALFRRGDLTIAISTAGKAPALAARIRQAFDRRFGDHYARFLDLAGRLRKPLKERYPDFETRRKLWYRLVDSDILDLLERGDESQAHQRLGAIMGVEPTETVP